MWCALVHLWETVSFATKTCIRAQENVEMTEMAISMTSVRKVWFLCLLLVVATLMLVVATLMLVVATLMLVVATLMLVAVCHPHLLERQLVLWKQVANLVHLVHLLVLVAVCRPHLLERQLVLWKQVANLVHLVHLLVLVVTMVAGVVCHPKLKKHQLLL